ncbi:MAG: hypothetical protein L0K86_25840 [Actinomycetia bacterium]|nr:hypothetical protein [Actinomycetes bacterium]
MAPAIPLPRVDSEQLALSGRDPSDVARRDQLARWHTPDTAAGTLVDAGPAREREETT